MRRVLIASDKFKGSLTAAQVGEHVAAGLRAAVPGLPVEVLPVADVLACALSASMADAPGVGIAVARLALITSPRYRPGSLRPI